LAAGHLILTTKHCSSQQGQGSCKKGPMPAIVDVSAGRKVKDGPNTCLALMNVASQ